MIMMKIKDPLEQKRLTVINLTVLCVFAAISLGGYLWMGLDFAKATLLGCAVVAVNFFVSQRLLGKVLLDKKVPPGMLLLYLGKLGIPGLVIYLAVSSGMDPWGLMLGLSSVVIASLVSSLLRGSSQAEET